MLVHQLSQGIIHQACICFCISGGFIKILEIVFQIEWDCFTKGINCHEWATCSVFRNEEFLDEIEDIWSDSVVVILAIHCETANLHGWVITSVFAVQEKSLYFSPGCLIAIWYGYLIIGNREVCNNVFVSFKDVCHRQKFLKVWLASVNKKSFKSWFPQSKDLNW